MNSHDILDEMSIIFTTLGDTGALDSNFTYSLRTKLGDIRSEIMRLELEVDSLKDKDSLRATIKQLSTAYNDMELSILTASFLDRLKYLFTGMPKCLR